MRPLPLRRRPDGVSVTSSPGGQRPRRLRNRHRHRRNHRRRAGSAGDIPRYIPDPHSPRSTKLPDANQSGCSGSGKRGRSGGVAALQRREGQFLIIELPSIQKGGELVIRHAGREVRVEARPNELSEAAFAAFYADCVHEVLPVISGCRSTLVYNLSRQGRRAQPVPPSYTAEHARLGALLGDWSEQKSCRSMRWPSPRPMAVAGPLLFWPRLKSARMFVMEIYRAILAAQERDGFLPDIIQLGRSRVPFAGRAPSLPVKALDLIGERRAGFRARQTNFEGVVLNLGGCRTA